MWKFLASAQPGSGVAATGPAAVPAGAAAGGAAAAGAVPAAVATAAAAARHGGRADSASGSGSDAGEDEDVGRELVGAASPPPQPYGRMPSAAPSPDAGMLWEVQPIGVSPALPFLTGHPLHGSSGGIPPPPAPALPPLPASALPAGGSGARGAADGAEGLAVASHKSPRLSPAFFTQVCCWLPPIAVFDVAPVVGGSCSCVGRSSGSAQPRP